MSAIDDKIAELKRQIELLESLKEDDPLKPYRELSPLPQYPSIPRPYYPLIPLPYTEKWSHPIGCMCKWCNPIPYEITYNACGAKICNCTGQCYKNKEWIS